ncbi:17136_t:CDS:2 [Racocetra fulgida]|uniref:17136_t:CDS:1 n=1 Tax=Racocetra fulgida TaxID=60492 RepID=A0A9N9H7N4_9GLOM|nr:17136_t:CDS:2 [Racocetra fulgida]
MESNDGNDIDKSLEMSDENSSHYNRFLQSRPQSLELNAISLVTRLAKEYSTVRTHIVHLSAANAIDMIRKSKSDGVPLTVETCFHYLCLSAEDVPLGRTEFKCCPPVREKVNQEKLWQALLDGTIDYVVSDHSPCTADLKELDKKDDERDFLKSWGGISTLQFGLPVLWTEAKKRGDIKVGYDADIVIWNPEETFTITKDIIQFKNKVTPYIGKTFYGTVKQTIVRGNIVYDAKKGGIINVPYGNLLV